MLTGSESLLRFNRDNRLWRRQVEWRDPPLWPETDSKPSLLSPQCPRSLRHDLWPSWPDTMYQRSLGPLLGKLHVHLQRADHKQIINKGWPSKLSTNVLFCLTKEITKVWYSLFNPSINLLKFRVVYNNRENLCLKRCTILFSVLLLIPVIVCENQSIIELKKTVAALQDIKNYLYVAILRRVLL